MLESRSRNTKRRNKNSFRNTKRSMSEYVRGRMEGG